MKNITLAVDDDVLADVRRYAAANNTTVNALVRTALEGIAERARRQESEWDELFRLADAAGAATGETAWSRDDLHHGVRHDTGSHHAGGHGLDTDRHDGAATSTSRKPGAGGQRP